MEKQSPVGETPRNECLAAFASSPRIACPLEMRWEAHLWAVKPLSSQAAGCLNNSLKTREVCTPSSDAQPDTL